MPTTALSHRRLAQQRLTANQLATPAEVVQWMGAVQSQDYGGGLYAIGLRMREGSGAAVERALADKSIVRIWFMRGTVHTVTGPDLRWMLKLIGPRMRRIVNTLAKSNGYTLDEALFARSNEVIGAALQGGKVMTRAELREALEQVGVDAAGFLSNLLPARAQADGLICEATRPGRNNTFALIDEWLPPAPLLDHEAARAELARRYFISHGPATLQDFVWWSGLLVADARAGLEDAKAHLQREVIDGAEYWHAETALPEAVPSPTVFLLPNYDEYLVAYRDRSAGIDPRYKEAWPQGNPIFSHTIIVDGLAVGTWKRAVKGDRVVVTPSLGVELSAAEQAGLEDAVRRYGEFLGQPAVLG